MTRYKAQLGRRSSVTAIVLALSAGLAAMPAAAQSVAGGTATSPSEQPEVVEDIVVTGSRIIRDGYKAPTPTTVLGAAVIEQSAVTNVGDLLGQLPSFQGGSTRTGTAINASQAAGANQINLRGLGNTRTLVLVDGARFTPTTNSETIDTNLIPVSLIDRVDVVTGGASAAYGSGAVAGVVNFVLKKDLQGLRANVSAGITQYGDNEDIMASFAFGTSFADGRGHVMAALEYEKNWGVSKQGSRPWQRPGFNVLANPAYTPTNGQPRQLLLPDVQLSVATLGGLITSGPLRGTQFGPGGTTSQFQYGSIVSGTFMSGGGGINAGLLVPLLPPLKRLSFFGRVSYDLTDDVTVTADVSHGRSSSSNPFVAPFNLGNLTIQRTNAFLPSNIVAQMTAANVTSFGFGRFSPDWGYLTTDNANTTDRGIVSLEGSLGDSWKWRAYAETGRTDSDGRVLNNVIVANLANAIDSVINPANGQPICRSTLTSPNNGCVPLNPFGQGSASQAALNYIHGTQFIETKLTQTSAGGSISGEPFSTWAGPVSVAAGAEYRREALNSAVDTISQTSGFLLGNPKAAKGQYSVKEAFAETVVPLLKDLPFAKELDLNAAIRLTDYSTSGTVTAWKVGGTYAVSDDISFRVTRSRDIRAPNLNELFQAAFLSFTTITNPANNVQSTIQQFTTGNRALKPERANTLTYGVVVTPTFIPGFSFSVDAYDIKVEDSIVTLPSQTIINNCFRGQSTFCPFVARDGAGNIASVTNVFFNLSKQTARGVDFEASYILPLSRLGVDSNGTLSFRGLANYVSNLTAGAGYNQAGEVGTQSFAGTSGLVGLPHWRADGHVTYANGPLTTDVEVRYIGGGSYSKNNAVFGIDKNDVASQTLVNLGVQYTLAMRGSHEVQIYGKVNNAFNARPPLNPFIFITPTQTNPALYDVVGRNFLLGVRVKM
ncbi:TonB-dependent receptor [Sphingomonas crocodyli]|nr:TonB-dependent receptor [Sphingomonas crocodyli]